MDVNALNNFHLEACLMGETNHVFNFIDRPDVTDSDVVKRADHTFNPGTGGYAQAEFYPRLAQTSALSFASQLSFYSVMFL